MLKTEGCIFIASFGFFILFVICKQEKGG